MERNKEREKREGPPAPNSAIQLPFIIVNTSKKTVIDCSISNDKMEYLFNFDDTFEIHDDMEVRVNVYLILVSHKDIHQVSFLIREKKNSRVRDFKNDCWI